mgnify:CR=1 FL=1
MKCSTCFNNINKFIKCNECQEKFCSEECISIHNRLYHKFLFNEVEGQFINNYSWLNYRPKANNFESKLLVKGNMNYNYIIYDPIFSIENFEFIYSNGAPKSIGKGSFGKVYLAFNHKNKKEYAIKHMEKDNLLKYLSCLDPIYAEIDIQSRINHPNIIKLLYVKETENTFDLVMDYAKYGTLFEYVVRHKGLKEEIAFKFFIQIANAIKFLHDNDIIHRDIKPENILLFENDVVKLCDFGWSIRCIDKLPGGSFSGTVEYMAPELINNLDYGKEIDMWMLGIFLYELMHGFSPFRPQKKKFEEKEVIDNIMNHKIIFYIPASEECKDLIVSLLEINFRKRYTIEDVFNSKFVKNFEREGFNINSLSIKGAKKKEKNNKINNKPNQEKTNTMKVSKSLLMNRYNDYDNDNEEISENKQDKRDNDINNKNKENDKDKNYRFFNSKRIESDNLLISKSKKGNLFSNKKRIDKNTMNIDDSFDDDEPNAPKNNKRKKNKKRSKRTIYESIVILGNNKKSNYLSPIKKLEETPNNDTSNSPKNNDKYKKKNKSFLNPNLIINNNNAYTNLRNFRERENLKLSNENIYDGNRTEKRIKKEITNFIFNNNKIVKKEKKNKIIQNNFSLNKNNPTLSLSFSNKVENHNSLQPESLSPDKVFIYPEVKEKSKNNNQNKKFHKLLNISENLSSFTYNLKNYPFDHLSNNSTMDMTKPKLKSTNHGNIIYKEKEEEDKEVIKEKEPIDNMKRKNKHQTPQDNDVKNIINKNENPDRKLINENFINNLNNYEKNRINNHKDEVINVNNSLSLSKGIKLQKENTDIMTIEPFNKNYKTDLRIQKRKNLIPIDSRTPSEEPTKNIKIKYDNENISNNNLMPIATPNKKNIYQNTDNNSFFMNQDLESSNSINEKIRMVRLINTDLREKKLRSVNKKINDFNFNKNNQKPGIKLVKINKSNNIEFIRKINDNERNIKKEQNKITKINKIEEIKNDKTLKEENFGIKIYKKGENKEIKIEESKKIKNFGNTKIKFDGKKEIKINESKNRNEINKKIVIEDFKEIEILKDNEIVLFKSKENDNFKNRDDKLNNENNENAIKERKELELQKKENKEKIHEAQINQTIKTNDEKNVIIKIEIEKAKLENKEIHLNENLEIHKNLDIKEDKLNEDQGKNNNRIETLNDKETERTEKIQENNNLKIKEEGKEIKNSKENEENNQDKILINNNLDLINKKKEFEIIEGNENKVEKQKNVKENKQPIIQDKNTKPIKNKEFKNNKKKVIVKKISPIVNKIDKEKSNSIQNKENNEKKAVKKNVITKKIEIKNGGNETIHKAKVITKKLNKKEKAYSKIKKQPIQNFEISQTQHANVNPDKKLGDQFPKMVTSKEAQSKGYSSKNSSVIRTNNENNTLKDKIIDFSNNNSNSMNYSQSLVINRKENIKAYSNMSPINSNKIIKSKSPNIRKPYFEENQSKNQQLLILDEDNGHDDDIKQIKLKKKYAGNNSIDNIFDNNIDKKANKNEDRNFSEVLRDKNYIENKVIIHKRLESNKEREPIVSLKKKNNVKIRCTKIETDELKNKKEIYGKSNYNNESFFNNGENKYGDNGLFN